MSKSLFIAEKPSVAKEFAKALGESFRSGDGFMESPSFVVTWCVGHLVAMSYPEKYDPALKRWRLETLPFIPQKYLYEVISGVKKQFGIVKKQLLRSDVDTIYVCTDSGREGEYIYRLVREEAGVKGKKEKRVWIDSQTEEEILRGIKEAKDLSAYDALSDSAYLRAKEDYLMGINFSRAMSLVYGDMIAGAVGKQYLPVAMGRVMTCVLGMIVKREREIREFVPIPFFKVNARAADGFNAEWRVSEGSLFSGSDRLYKDNGFLKREDAEYLIQCVMQGSEDVSGDAGQGNGNVPFDSSGKSEVTQGTPDADGAVKVSAERTLTFEVLKAERKKEKKNPPLLYNLAELQNDCARIFKISPENTLKIAQELYEKKLTTYPRTDARVLSKAVCKEITKNINGLKKFGLVSDFASEIMDKELYKGLEKTKYCDDKKITDHYAIIPTGFGIGSVAGLSRTAACVYEMICRRFLSIFYPPAVYNKTSLVLRAETRGGCPSTSSLRQAQGEAGNPSTDLENEVNPPGIKEVNDTFTEEFCANFKVLADEGYLRVAKNSFDRRDSGSSAVPENADNNAVEKTGKVQEGSIDGSGNNTDTGVVSQDLKKNKADNPGDDNNSGIPASVNKLKKGDKVIIAGMTVKESETTPPKRYNSGSMILAMENAGQLIEDEELREQIKGSGIGTSATRAGILEKLDKNDYINVNPKTQILTPTFTGEMIYDAARLSLNSLLSPELTASWEKGLAMVASGEITADEYMEKLEGFVRRRTAGITGSRNLPALRGMIEGLKRLYK